ncbi:response regulator transcription factor [Aquibium microcysteis]|uniref:response regulator transcription factor n=1 Tax=Aquibium microcysteis TaxID=675281 RepID=UPI001AED56C8|nr:response regulator [Aquibium microcysteis]
MPGGSGAASLAHPDARYCGRRDIERTSGRPLVAIVDDDSKVRSGLSSLLRSEGFRVDQYEHAEAFLAALPEKMPDCLLTDIQLPGADGLDLQLEMSRQFPALPIVVMTAYPSAALRDRAIRQGALRFLSKPFSHDELLSSILQAVER